MPQHGAKNVVTLFHKPSSQASTRVLTLLKQTHAQPAAHATEDQASSHEAQSKPAEFELDVTEEPPTSDQLKNILEYLGGPNAASKIISGASDESDALRRLKADGDAFRRPLVSSLGMLGEVMITNNSRLWTGIQARQVCSYRHLVYILRYVLTHVVIGESESEILSLLRSKSEKA